MCDSMKIFSPVVNLFKSVPKNLKTSRRKPKKEEKLFLAASSGDILRVRNLLERGAAPDFCDYRGSTSLMQAARKGYIDIVRQVISAGADLEATDDNENTALKSAAIKGHADVVDLLISSGANLEAKDSLGRTPLMCAVLHNEVEVVCRLLCAGSDTEAACNAPQGWTPLFYAASLGHAQLVNCLLESGANFDALDTQGGNALFYAAQYGYFDVIQELLFFGAKAKHQDHSLLAEVRAQIGCFKVQRAGWTGHAL